MDKEMIDAAKSIISDIRKAGFDCLVVGGAVRDIICGSTPKDIDLVTTAHPDELEKIFPDIRWAGRAFGVSLLKRGNHTFELASARLERTYLDGRHPENIVFSRSFEDDVIRRDFTVNALLYDPFTGKITDYVNGIADAEKKLIRCVGEPEKRFSEDALRMLRAVRFASLRNFQLEEKSLSAIKELAHNVKMLAGERIKSELDKILVSAQRRKALETMRETGLLKAVLPEVDALYGVRQEKKFHPEGDVFTHTCIMLDRMQYPGTTLAWSVILHDIGKAVTTFEDENHRIRAFGHEEKGAQMVENIASRLKFSTAEKESITAAVRNHMRMANVRNMREAKLKRMMLDSNFPLELELHRLDCISSHGIMDCYLFLLDNLASDENIRNRELKALVSGKELIGCGFTPSPLFKKVLDEIFDRQLAGEFKDKKSALEAAVRVMDLLQHKQ